MTKENTNQLPPGCPNTRINSTDQCAGPIKWGQEVCLNSCPLTNISGRVTKWVRNDDNTQTMRIAQHAKRIYPDTIIHNPNGTTKKIILGRIVNTEKELDVTFVPGGKILGIKKVRGRRRERK
ncbi:hypothetical protein JXA63_04005 [Candidatus Woesebacteria bacterium]|nr:hypothetical protein [Candidatus Woesebacteria bacterium]